MDTDRSLVVCEESVEEYEVTILDSMPEEDTTEGPSNDTLEILDNVLGFARYIGGLYYG